MAVSTSPIPFTALPRQSGDDLVETVTADIPFAAAIDANFAKVNTWANARDASLKVTRLSNTALITFATNWTWYTANQFVDGYLVGNLRSFTVLAKYTGANLTKDPATGKLSPAPVRMFTLPSSWAVGDRQLFFTGGCGVGTAAVRLDVDGGVYLCGVSHLESTLPTFATNTYVAVTATYLRPY